MLRLKFRKILKKNWLDSFAAHNLKITAVNVFILETKCEICLWILQTWNSIFQSRLFWFNSFSEYFIDETALLYRKQIVTLERTRIKCSKNINMDHEFFLHFEEMNFKCIISFVNFVLIKRSKKSFTMIHKIVSRDQ